MFQVEPNPNRIRSLLSQNNVPKLKAYLDNTFTKNINILKQNNPPLLFLAVLHNCHIDIIKLLLNYGFSANQTSLQTFPHLPIDVVNLKREDIIYELIFAGSNYWHARLFTQQDQSSFLDFCAKNTKHPTLYPTVKRAIIDKAYQDGLNGLEFFPPNVNFTHDHSALFTEAKQYSLAAIHTGRAILEQKTRYEESKGWLPKFSYAYNVLTAAPTIEPLQPLQEHQPLLR